MTAKRKVTKSKGVKKRTAKSPECRAEVGPRSNGDSVK